MSTPRFAYLADGSDIWADVAEELSSSYGMDPLLWFGHPGHTDFVRGRFGRVQFLDERKLDDGDFLRSVGRTLPRSVRDSVQVQTALVAALDSMQRNEVHRLIPYLARRVYLSSLCEFLWAHLHDLGITHVVAAQAPHSPSGLIFSGLTEAAGIPMLHFQHSTVGPFALPRVGTNYDLLDMSDLVTRDQIARPSLEDVRWWVDQFAEHTIDRGVPEIDAKYYEVESGNRGFLGLLRQLKYTALDLRRPSVSSSVSISPPMNGGLQWILASVRSVRSRRQRSKRLIDAHSQVVSTEVLPDSFWLAMLHYEPEKSTNPDGGGNRDQLEFIRAIARHLPEGGALVIREHPAQFTMSKPGYAGKDPSFYQELGSIEGVIVADTRIENWELIDRATLSFTITGTLGLEALVAGIPVVHCGLPWYRGFPGTFYVEELSQIDRVIARATAHSVTPSVKEDLVAFTRERSVNAVITPGTVRFYDQMGKEWSQDVKSVAAVIAGFLRR